MKFPSTMWPMLNEWSGQLSIKVSHIGTASPPATAVTQPAPEQAALDGSSQLHSLSGGCSGCSGCAEPAPSLQQRAVQFQDLDLGLGGWQRSM